MKKTLQLYSLLFGFLLLPGIITAQCTPGNASTCPDPENNGQICPDSLPNAIIDEPYMQEFTILAPPSYTYGGFTVDLHHIKLLSIDNLPPGISWISNAADSVFMVGTYYCVLLDGTPTVKGSYPLKIVVDVWIDPGFGQPPLNVGAVTDSTSLAIHVTDPSGTGGLTAGISSLELAPNPFGRFVDISFYTHETDQGTLELYSLVGGILRSTPYRIQPGNNVIRMDGADLLPGIYFISLRTAKGVITRRIVKSN